MPLGRSTGEAAAGSVRGRPHYGDAVILLIDNYDSFTFNLVQRIGELLVAAGRNADELPIRVVRNDQITVAEAEALAPAHIIISPGPCTPTEAGVSCALIEAFAGRIPLLGVCLGHQSIGQQFGMTVDRHPRLMHGKTSPMNHDGRTLFAGLPDPFIATRYHSLVIRPDTFDHDRFEISAWCEDDIDGRPQRVIQAMRARPGALGTGRDAPLEGVQFHPESFMTPDGPRLLANFLGLPAPASATTQAASPASAP